MKATGKNVKRMLSVLLCCLLLLLPLGMTAGAVQADGPEYEEDGSRAPYIEKFNYSFVRQGTSNSVKFSFYARGVSTVTNIKVWVEIQSSQGGKWAFYMDENSDSGLEGSGNPLKYEYTRTLPKGQYKAIFTVRAYKFLIYQTSEYTTTEVFIN